MAEFIEIYFTGSIPSLAAGFLFGGILLFGAVEASKTPANYNIQLAATSILTGVMGYRYYSTGKMVPGVVTLLSVGMLLNIGVKAAGLTSSTRN